MPHNKKPSGPQVKVYKLRESRSARFKKKKRERAKPPAVGERKAARKRIVLSNPNALEIKGMEDLTTANMADIGQVGRVLGLNGALLDQLRDLKAFKTTQNWSMFRRPATLIREETVQMGRQLSNVNESIASQDGPRTVRQIITGERATGKSMLVLQAMSMALLNQWIVIHVPEGELGILSMVRSVVD